MTDWAGTDARLSSVHARMRAAVAGPGDGRDGLYRWLSYHLGWADAGGRPVEQRAAKGIRPLVCLTACEAVGGEADLAAPAAAAVELTHEFSLVHDDIEDGDRRRRGRPALWAVVGAPQAINAGDALFTLARRQLTEHGGGWPDGVALDLIRRYDAACLRLAEGQFLDIGFESAARVALDDYIAMVAGKTGALLGAAAAMGARAGGAVPAVADAFSRYGEAVGVAFQMQDDVLGLWGDPGHTGKPAGNDLARRKKSLPIILALSDPVQGPPLGDVLAAERPPDPAAVALWTGRLAAAGYRDQARALARRYAETALAALAELDLAAGPRAALEALARQAVERER